MRAPIYLPVESVEVKPNRSGPLRVDVGVGIWGAIVADQTLIGEFERQVVAGERHGPGYVLVGNLETQLIGRARIYGRLAALLVRCRNRCKSAVQVIDLATSTGNNLLMYLPMLMLLIVPFVRGMLTKVITRLARIMRQTGLIRRIERTRRLRRMRSFHIGMRLCCSIWVGRRSNTLFSGRFVGIYIFWI